MLTLKSRALPLLINEGYKIFRKDSLLVFILYVLITSLLYFVAFFESDFRIDDIEYLNYFKKILPFSFFFFALIQLVSIGSEFSQKIYHQQLLAGLTKIDYVKIKITFIFILALFFIILEVSRFWLIAFFLNLKNLHVLFTISDIINIYLGLSFCGLAGLSVILTFKKAWIGIIFLYLYIQIESLIRYISISFLKIDFKYLPSAITSAFVAGGYFSYISTIFLLSYLIIFLTISFAKLQKEELHL